MKNLASFIFELGMLKKIRRSGFPFLGSGGESIADHSFRAALIGYYLGILDGEADAGRVALLLLHHDLPESRTGDLNYVQKQYVTANENKSKHDQAAMLPEKIAHTYTALYEEYNFGQTKEAELARDADQLDLLAELKEQQDLGNPYAKEWIHFATKRLSTKIAKKLAEDILSTDWSHWWFEKNDDLWVGLRHKKD